MFFRVVESSSTTYGRLRWEHKTLGVQFDCVLERAQILLCAHQPAVLLINSVTKGEGERKCVTRRRKPYFFFFFLHFIMSFPLSPAPCSRSLFWSYVRLSYYQLCVQVVTGEWWSTEEDHSPFFLRHPTSQGWVIDPWKQKQGILGGGRGWQS